jgi:hypothetical protein
LLRVLGWPSGLGPSSALGQPRWLGPVYGFSVLLSCGRQAEFGLLIRLGTRIRLEPSGKVGRFPVLCDTLVGWLRGVGLSSWLGAFGRLCPFLNTGIGAKVGWLARLGTRCWLRAGRRLGAFITRVSSPEDLVVLFAVARLDFGAVGAWTASGWADAVGRVI